MSNDVCSNGCRAADSAKVYELKPNGKTEAKHRLIMSSREFVAGYVAPQYLIEGIIQQRRLYSLTGKTGDGKTALQLYFAYLLATGTPLGKREVEQCRVLYLAGENPDDVQARWIAMADIFGFDDTTIDVHFIKGKFSITDMLEQVRIETEEIGGFGAVIIDTSASYFEGDQENDNVQLGNWARLLRELTDLPGNPAVIVGCHPIKSFKSGETLLPRGGGAFLAVRQQRMRLGRIEPSITQRAAAHCDLPDARPP